MSEPESPAGGPGAIFETMARLEREGTPYALATVVAAEGSSPRHLGARMLVLADGTILDTIGGGKLEKIVIADALEALSTGRSSLKTYDLAPEAKGGIGTECGGAVQVFLEVRGRRPRLVIFGGGHVGLALASAARPLGFALTVVDPREDFARPERFPAGARVVKADPAGPEAAAAVPDGAFVVILTHSHDLDRAALKNVLGGRPAYVGMIGSRRKVKVLLEQLAKEGAPRDRLSAVFAPIGLDIGAETPEEIAVSILAEIVHVLRRGGPSPASLRGGRGGEGTGKSEEGRGSRE
jgi:xanthine dehydrogenase accessory factor